VYPATIYNQAVVILHKLKKSIDRLRSIVFPFSMERICLINEEDAVEGLFHNLLCFQRGTADVTAHQPGSVDIY
jgi:hypothetical protein